MKRYSFGVLGTIHFDERLQVRIKIEKNKRIFFFIDPEVAKALPGRYEFKIELWQKGKPL